MFENKHELGSPIYFFKQYAKTLGEKLELEFDGDKWTVRVGGETYVAKKLIDISDQLENP